MAFGHELPMAKRAKVSIQTRPQYFPESVLVLPTMKRSILFNSFFSET